MLVSAYLNGQYGEKDIYAVVPCVLGANGVEKIIELSLSDEEMKELKDSVKVLKGRCCTAETLKRVFREDLSQRRRNMGWKRRKSLDVPPAI